MRIMKRARALGMATKDYVYLYYALLPTDQVYTPWQLPGSAGTEDLNPKEFEDLARTFYNLKQVQALYMWTYFTWRPIQAITILTMVALTFHRTISKLNFY